MPTTIVLAPRRRAVSAIKRSERATKESMTSMAVTSMTIPRARWPPTRSTSSSRSATTSRSERSDWIDAIRTSPWRRIATDKRRPLRRLAGVLGSAGLGAHEALGHLQAALEVADRAHHAEIDAELDERLRDPRRQARDDRARPHEPGGLDGLH